MKIKLSLSLLIINTLIIYMFSFPTISKATPSITSNLVKQIYIDILRRNATPFEIQTDTDRVIDNQTNPFALISEKIKSPESINKYGKLISVYDAITNTVPSYSQYNNYLSLLSSGKSLSYIASQIFMLNINSQNFVKLTDSDFIQKLYKNIYNETIPSFALSSYLNAIRVYGKYNTAVLLATSNSSMTKQQPVYEVYISYTSFLKSSPAQNEMLLLLSQYQNYSGIEKQITQNLLDPRAISRYLSLFNNINLTGSSLSIGDRYIDSASLKLVTKSLTMKNKSGVIAAPGSGPCNVKNSISNLLDTFTPKFLVIGYSFEQNLCYSDSSSLQTKLSVYKNDIIKIVNEALSRNIKVYLVEPPQVPNSIKNSQNSYAKSIYRIIKSEINNVRLHYIAGDRYFSTFLDEYQSSAYNQNGIDLCRNLSLPQCTSSNSLVNAYAESIMESAHERETNYCNQLGIIGDSRTMITTFHNRPIHIVNGDSLNPFGTSQQLLNNAPAIEAVMGFRYDTPDHIDNVLLMLSKCKTRVIETILGPNHTWNTTANSETPYNWDSVDTAALYSMLDRITRYGGKAVVIAYFTNPTSPNTVNYQKIRAGAIEHDQAVLDYIQQNPTKSVTLKYISLPNNAWNIGGEIIHPTAPVSETDVLTGQDWVIRESVLAAKSVFPFL